MGKMDKSSTLGFILLGVLLLGYMYFNQRSENAYEKAKKASEDSIALVHKHIADSLGVSVNADTAQKRAVAAIPATQDSTQNVEQNGVFAAEASGKGELTTIQTDLFKITFNSKGARPQIVQLLKYKAYTGGPLMLQNADYNNLGLQFLTKDGKLINTANLNFTLVKNNLLPDSSRQIQYRLYAGDPQKYLQYTYT
ncbi:MAG: hypothetical protein ACRDE2_00480, partial [Chitinophagaceae bacterium]